LLIEYLQPMKLLPHKIIYIINGLINNYENIYSIIKLWVISTTSSIV
jgi:hypothetical protein